MVGALWASERARVLGAQSNANAMEARANAERLDAENRWRTQAAIDLANLMHGFDAARESGLAGEVLVSLWMLETTHGPMVLNDASSLNLIRRERIATVRKLADQSVAESGEDSYGSLQLRSLLAFLLTKEGEYAEAEELVVCCTESWRDRLEVQDPWLSDLDAMRAVAATGRKIEVLSSRPPVDLERAECVGLERLLRKHNERLAFRPDGAQLRLLILESLRTVYGPECFAHEQWSDWTEQSIASLGLGLPRRGLASAQP